MLKPAIHIEKLSHPTHDLGANTRPRIGTNLYPHYGHVTDTLPHSSTSFTSTRRGAISSPDLSTVDGLTDVTLVLLRITYPCHIVARARKLVAEMVGLKSIFFRTAS